MNCEADIDKLHPYVKEYYEAKYQFLIKKLKEVGLFHFDDAVAFIKYANDMQGVYKNIQNYDPEKKE